jgi:hypothetical protein
MNPLTLRERVEQWPVIVSKSKYKPNCWIAWPFNWNTTLKADGEMIGRVPSGEGSTEQEALDACRKNIADMFAVSWVPVT